MCISLNAAECYPPQTICNLFQALHLEHEMLAMSMTSFVAMELPQSSILSAAFWNPAQPNDSERMKTGI